MELLGESICDSSLTGLVDTEENKMSLVRFSFGDPTQKDLDCLC
jgi:hypothetical protein